MDRMAMKDPNMRSCCTHCDVGKNKSVVKLEKGIQKEVKIAQTHIGIIGNLDFRSIMDSGSCDSKRLDHQTFNDSSPPRFIIYKQFLI
jgi:hypothetical protein